LTHPKSGQDNLLGSPEETRMKLAMAALIGSALLLSSTSFSLTVPSLEECPDECVNHGYESVLGSSCAVVEIEPIAELGGEGADECAVTCSTCNSLVKIEWDCSGCLDTPCVWVWGNQSYDRNGAALDLQSGAGTGSGEITLRVTTNCNGLTARFGVSVAGMQKRYNLECPCE
jgi:hypothetical protein